MDENQQKYGTCETGNTGLVSSEQNHEGELLWAKNHATVKDTEATDMFIKIVGGKYQLLLNDKKKQKFKFWEDVYEDMVKLGYHIATNKKEGGIKCSQKWRNLQRSYVQFNGQEVKVIQHLKIKRPPIHYEKLQKVLKDTCDEKNLRRKSSLFGKKEPKRRLLDLKNPDTSRRYNTVRIRRLPAPAPSRLKTGLPLWVKKNPSPEDSEATDTFIRIVGSEKYQTLLNNRKTKKSEVWQAVYREMMRLGYKVAADTADGAIRCSQKWRNLERAYIQYLTKPETDSACNTREKKPPAHFDLLHAVLKDRLDLIHVEVPLSPVVEEPEPSKLQLSTGSCEESNECPDNQLQLEVPEGDSSDVNREEEYFTVEYSPENVEIANENKDQQQSIGNEESKATPVCNIVPEAMLQQNSSNVFSQGELLWSTNHATAADLEATSVFIKIVGSVEIQSMLNDRRARKSQVWQQVYQEMIKLGYYVADNVKDGGVKCAQKWRNLEWLYFQYVGETRTAEKRQKKRPPLHYEEMHAVLKDKKFRDYVKSSAAAKDVDQNLTAPNSDVDMKVPGNSPASFSVMRNTQTSETTSQDVLQLVMSMAQKQEEQFTKLCEILDRQNDEKKRLTDAIVAYLSQSLEPRKRKASETDSD